MRFVQTFRSYLHPCRMRRRCCRCRCFCLFLLVMLVMAGVFLGYIFHRTPCSTEESLEFIETVCAQYAEKKITGDLCENLCALKTIKFEHCISSKEEKKILVCRHHGSPLILKSFRPDFSDLDIVDSRMDIAQFYDIISNTLRFHFNVTLEKYAAFWNIDPDVQSVGKRFAQEMWHGEWIEPEDMSAAELQTFMYSLWMILHQEEYITMQSLKASPHIPRVYGTCGAIYAMESAPPGLLLSQQMLPKFGYHPWKTRAKLALKILDAADRLSALGPLHQRLHLCDVKGENFGIGEDGVIKAIDVDMAFVEDKLSSELQAGNCTKHADCDFFECRGWCDVSNQKCTGIRRNNNLQSVCYKIFTSRSSNIFNGLLSNPPDEYRNEVDSVLRDCLEPPIYQDEITKYRTMDETKEQLRDLLQASLDE